MPDSAFMTTGEGLEKRRMAVWASGVSTAVRLAKVPRPRGWFGFSRLRKEKATSAEVKSVPSCHFTPWRSVNLMDRPSADGSHAVARRGRGRKS